MIDANSVSKFFYKPIRKPGLKGMASTLFSPKKEVIKAVDGISFHIDDGEIVGYIGSNGAGKSTTIKMMSGILTPTSGEILINGLAPYKSKNRDTVLKDVGVVFGQRTQLWWDLPLIETFNLYKDIYDIPKNDFQERFDFLSELLGLDQFISSPVRSLSLGQRMRADLAAAMIHNPRILFLDEPTIGLDVLVKERITKAILEINRRERTTVILTTHDMTDIANLCSRVIIIDSGHLLYDGTIDHIKKRFGDVRHVSLLSDFVGDPKEAVSSFDGLVSYEGTLEGYMTFSYDADKVKTNVLLPFLLDKFNAKDVRLNENPLSDVVKKIYESKAI